jgi:urocanate hydratase
LGYSVAEILKASGKKVYKTQIINDRGIHICKSMLAWNKLGKGQTPESTGLKGDKLVGNYYVKFDSVYKEEVAALIASGKHEDLAKTDAIARSVLEEMMLTAPIEIQEQLADNIKWIIGAQENKLVVGSQARILYADAEGRMKIASAFNTAIQKGEIGPVVLGRDHHDVSGTDSPYRETSNIYDGSRFTADMAIQNVIGDSFRGATWVSIHNGGGVGWGEVINGGFGMLLDGTKEASKRIEMMLFWDVNNGISRRSWARNEGAVFAIKRAMEAQPLLKVTLPNTVDDNLFL